MTVNDLHFETENFDEVDKSEENGIIKLWSYEYDAYPSGNISADRKPFSKEEEDRLAAEMKERIRHVQEKDLS